MVIAVHWSSAQKESSYWYFGNAAGLHFNESDAEVVLDGALVTNEGCATISNNKGELLFYTDGTTVWDRRHHIMSNGTGLMGHSSSTQSAIIVPQPNSSSIYYIFTVSDAGNPDGLRYTEVDLSLNNGLGAVTMNKNVPLFTPCSEKIAAVHHSNGKDFWVISHAWNSNEFLVFSVTDNGVNTTPMKRAIGSYHGGHANNSLGYLKVSPDGTKLAIAKWYTDSFVELFNFDTRTGAITDPILINGVFDNDGRSGAYGLEFSPNGNLLYVSDFNLAKVSSKLHQFDVSNYDKDAILTSDSLIYSGPNLLSAIQLALDGKIYISNSYTSFLDVIDNPNVRGIGCEHRSQVINLGDRITVFGLPSFIQSYFVGSIEADNICLGNAGQFKLEINQPIDSITWELGDGQMANSSEASLEYLYKTPGVYEVNAKVISGHNTYYLNQTIVVYDNPSIDINTDWFICDQEPVILYLNSSHDGYLWSTGETTSVIEIKHAGTYGVTVFNDTADPSIVCEDTVEIEVFESGLAVINNIEIKDWTFHSNSISVHAQGNGAYEYSIDNLFYQDQNTFNDLLPGDYIVYVRDKKGCGIVEKMVYIMNYPKFFTPNGDGKNDYWQIQGLSTLQADSKIYIYDRYGKLLKQLYPLSMGWDGTFHGAMLPTSDYWFHVELADGRSFKGHFTLKR
ncbi:T9SS type B sorting domain-containing protein [Aestuariivivens sediminis]|uniref:T9SS type B sorting domain-containing protein n=1 Tax=Aestuariivivens sediminis TaxID=2913557 RepID=UPI001F55CC8E|nr:T9SS type B sorting domain-containing protein [Aestuariivivens sediminis]